MSCHKTPKIEIQTRIRTFDGVGKMCLNVIFKIRRLDFTRLLAKLHCNFVDPLLKCEYNVTKEGAAERSRFFERMRIKCSAKSVKESILS